MVESIGGCGDVEMWRGGELASNWGDSPVRQGLYTLSIVTLSDMDRKRKRKDFWKLLKQARPGQVQYSRRRHGWLNKDNGAVIDPCALIFMDDCTRTMEQSLTPVHGWLHKDNEAPSSPIAQGSMTVRLLPMSDKVTMESVYKHCLTGESPQLLASSPALHISTSTNTFYNLSRSVTDKKATSNCFPLAIKIWPDMLQV